MSVFHRKHSNSSPKNQPVLLSLERPNNSQTDSLPEEVEGQMEGKAIAKTKGERKIPDRTIKHVKSYPLVQQTRSLLYRLPVARVVIANTKPVVKQVLESKPLQLAFPVTNFFDNVANSSLNLTEKIVPAIKTKTYQNLKDDAMMPCNTTVEYSKKTTGKIVSLVEDNVYKPSHNQVMKFRKFYNEKIYDTKGKPLIRSTLNPITAPFNNLFENLTIKYFPEGEKVPTEGYSSELNRSVALAWNFVNRSYPVVQKGIVHIGMIPCNYVIYVNNVFNESLDSQPDLKPKHCWQATKVGLTRVRKETMDSIKQKSPHRIFKKRQTVNKTNLIKPNRTPVEAFHERIREVENQLHENVTA
ncbi:hypothetical protein HG537_0G01070 [Torulaspora globosa]|uniref:Uncharacterized protein n=1 Tax=Torulaspora globosa TaxID=48254 RepID=A0A7H9HX24_9SACH|nr:hypothetical protein HG537_0G01070 [Torulaspora sp. CBS 2947]